MANVSAFLGFHYSPEVAANLNEVITPPYDVIPAGQEKVFWQRSPYNFAHVDLPLKEGDDYTSASQTLQQWIERKILRGDLPSYFWYRQTFIHDGTEHTRDALMCAVQLADFSEGIIRPHENTHGKAKKDRLQSLRKTGFNLSSIFGMVKDPEGFLTSLAEHWEFQAPLLRGKTEDGSSHTVWRLEPEKVSSLQGFFSEKPIYIVDGHHRYESSLAYAKETGAYGSSTHPAAFTLFTICNAFDPGLVVLPTHRGVKSLGGLKNLDGIRETFDLVASNTDVLRSFVSRPVNTPSFMLGVADELFVCTPKHWETKAQTMGQALYRLPMHWSDRKLLGEILQIPESEFGQRIAYEKDALALWNRRQEFDLTLFHAQPKVTDVTDIADEAAFMPPKSTYFFPKLASGLVIRKLG